LYIESIRATLNLSELRPADYALTVDVYWTLVMFCFFCAFYNVIVINVIN